MGCGGMDMQLAELAPEGEMLLRRDVLVAEKDHEIFGKRAMDLVHLAIGGRVAFDEIADIDAGNLRADDRRQLLDRDGLVGLGLHRRCADSGVRACLTASSWRFSRLVVWGVW